jgi:hypothetical protein
MRIDILLGRKKLDTSVGSFKSRELGDIQVGNSTVGRSGKWADIPVVERE